MKVNLRVMIEILSMTDKMSCIREIKITRVSALTR